MKKITILAVSFLVCMSCSKSVTSYNMDFDGNGNDSGAAPQRTTFEKGKSMMVPGRGTLSKKGFQFDGWNTKADRSGTQYSEGASALFEGDVTLYAAWSPLPESKPAEKPKPNLFRDASESSRVFNLYSMKDGRILVTNEVPHFDYMKRYEHNGDLDASFNNTLPYNEQIFGIQIQPDSKIVVFGKFDEVGSSIHKGIVRLNPNGTIDNSFSYGGGDDYDFNRMHMQTSGKIVITGYFHDAGGSLIYDLRRLNSDGSIDASFHDASEEIKALGLTPKSWDMEIDNDKIYYAACPLGDFNITRYSIHIIRLNEDGTLDDSFKGLSFTDVIFTDMNIQPDGRIVIRGSILLDKKPGPVPTGSVLHSKNWNSRYNPDGSEDPTYRPYDVETKTFTSYVLAPHETIDLSVTKYRTVVVPIWTKDGVVEKTFSLTDEMKFLSSITVENESSVLVRYYTDEDLPPGSILRIVRVKL
jgi:uncharacterized delta-60 repeat protein